MDNWPVSFIILMNLWFQVKKKEQKFFCSFLLMVDTCQ